jgi:hypothetical protein
VAPGRRTPSIARSIGSSLFLQIEGYRKVNKPWHVQCQEIKGVHEHLFSENCRAEG